MSYKNQQPTAISYRDAGVNIDAGEKFVRRILPLAQKTQTANVLGSVGGYAGLYALPTGLTEPVLVSGTDGVGTKLKIAFEMGIHNTIGIDLVAMCVNDIISLGAKPLFFLDYFATPKLKVDEGEDIVRGIAQGCNEAGCALLGGETAEMPGFYATNEYDLAGFAVGIIERAEILGPNRVKHGDVLVAIASNGLHSNGYSLARRVLLEHAGLYIDQPIESLGVTLGTALLTPTCIYVDAVLALKKSCKQALHACAHITGGGLVENIPRILPEGAGALLKLQSYTLPPLFSLIQQLGPVQDDEMLRTFNMGVGFVALIDASAVNNALSVLKNLGLDAWQLGEVIPSHTRSVEFE